jgi:hypothetical protein
MHVPQEFYVLAYTIAVTALIALPRILQKHYMPRELQFEQVPESSLSTAQAEFFAKSDKRMAEIGYMPFTTFRVTNLMGRNLTRAYMNSTEPTFGLVCAITGPKGLNSTSFCEFITRFTDGTRLTTRNTENAGSLFDRMPSDVVQDFRGTKDPVELKKKHDAKLAEMNNGGVEFVDPAKFFTRYQSKHREWCEYQESKSLLRWDATTSQYRLTPWTALRGIRNYYNPLGSHFTVPRFIMGLLLGAGIPTLVLWNPEHTLDVLGRLSFVDPMRTGLVVFPLAFILGGVAIGTIYKSKSFIWGFIASCLPAMAAPQIGTAAVTLGIIMGFSAKLTGRLAMARGRIA